MTAALPNVTALRGVLRAFAIFALATGSLDVVLGADVLAISGATVPPASSLDPMLDSQLRFCGGIWAGWGAMLLWTCGDLPARRAALTILALSLLVSGLGRSFAAALHGQPPLLLGLIAVEVVGPPLVLLWARRAFPSAYTGSAS